MIKKKNERLRGSLDECFNSGLVTIYQMMKGFGSVSESLDDLALWMWLMWETIRKYLRWES